MIAAALSIIVVCVAFVALIVWVYRPRDKQRWERRGFIPLEEDDRDG